MKAERTTDHRNRRRGRRLVARPWATAPGRLRFPLHGFGRPAFAHDRDPVRLFVAIAEARGAVSGFDADDTAERSPR
ncbi:hypothetical protein [Embleya scabrispora]|uniref:hypothetical protein n=1 Tax=Embleya scabrispora TaxID=159449 RepID=UPI0005934691|nr:hypothetical protein [Embleya scabrispora]MYS80892.1 hypothetical protein [Streptomyces sp. SID5474]